MKVNLIAVGSLKSDYLQAGVADFEKRLQNYVDLKIVEVKAKKIRKNLSQAQQEQLKKEEAEELIAKLSNSSYSIALDSQGKPMTSVGLAKSIGNLQVQGYSELDFIIGGTLGLHNLIKEEADYLLSLSHLTFTHEMVRLIILEQIYRAFKIINGEEYHR